MHVSMVHGLRYFVFHFTCFILKSNMYDAGYRKCVYQPIVTQKKIFEDFYLVTFSKKKSFCGRPHEIYFRHPVRRKQSFIFFWPLQKNKNIIFFQQIFVKTNKSLTQLMFSSGMVAIPINLHTGLGCLYAITMFLVFIFCRLKDQADVQCQPSVT